MKRLTKLDNDITKVKGTYMPYDERHIVTLSDATYIQCLLNKLGKLEDLLEKYGISNSVNFDYLEKCIQDHDKYGELQEQLGCPLDVVFKALKYGVYYEDVANCMRYMVADLHCNLVGDFVLYFDDEEHLLTRNYKKTWWLREDKSE